MLAEARVLDKNFTPAPAERLGGFPDSLFQP